ILDNALATMGAGLPSAMMVKELNPDKKVISINGDGGFMMNSQELETATRLNLDLVILILNDNAYGMIEWKQKDEGFSRYGLNYSNHDLEKYPESCKANVESHTTINEFVEKLEEAMTAKGIHHIDHSIDYSLIHEIQNVMIKKYSKNRKK